LQFGVSHYRKTLTKCICNCNLEKSFQTWQPTSMPVAPADVKVITPGPLVTPLPPIIHPSTNSNAAVGSEITNQDSQDEFSSRGSGREHSDDVGAPGASSGTTVSSVVVPGLPVKEEPGLKEDQMAASEKEARERAKDRSERPEKSERHRDRWVVICSLEVRGAC
jgi:hypothetical protein